MLRPGRLLFVLSLFACHAASGSFLAQLSRPGLELVNARGLLWRAFANQSLPWAVKNKNKPRHGGSGGTVTSNNGAAKRSSVVRPAPAPLPASSAPLRGNEKISTVEDKTTEALVRATQKDVFHDQHFQRQREDIMAMRNMYQGLCRVVQLRRSSSAAPEIPSGDLSNGGRSTSSSSTPEAVSLDVEDGPYLLGGKWAIQKRASESTQNFRRPGFSPCPISCFLLVCE